MFLSELPIEKVFLQYFIWVCQEQNGAWTERGIWMLTEYPYQVSSQLESF